MVELTARATQPRAPSMIAASSSSRGTALRNWVSRKMLPALIAPGTAEGAALLMGAVNALVTQTASINRAVTVLGLSKVDFEGSDSLDNPNAVFQ